MSNKSHILLNATIRGLNTAVLCVVEYENINVFPTSLPVNVYVVSKYNEEDDTVEHDFTMFNNLRNKKHETSDPFEQLLEVEKWMETINYNNERTSKVEIDGYEISEHLKTHHNSDVDALEVDIDDMLIYIKECFYVNSVEEYKLRSSIHKNPFAEPLLNNLLFKRKENIEKYQANPFKTTFIDKLNSKK